LRFTLLRPPLSKRSSDMLWQTVEPALAMVDALPEGMSRRVLIIEAAGSSSKCGYAA
jgi:hypothetical protein